MTTGRGQLARGLALLLCAAFLVTSGCERSAAVDQPELKVDPPRTLYFPRVIAGTVDVAPVVLHNVGRAPLTIGDLRFGRADSPFSLDAEQETSFVIEPGSSVVLSVLYTPTVGGDEVTDEDVLTIESDDPEPSRASWEVEIRTSNTGPVISIVPPEIDFSLVEGHRGPVQVTVLNSGTEPTTVETLQLEGGPEFSHDFDTSQLPIDLQPGDSFDLHVSCSAADATDLGSTTGISTLVALPADESHQAGQATLYGPPMADAGPDVDCEPMPQTAKYLNGRGSRSLGNTITLYEWTAIEWPEGSVDASAFNAGAVQAPDYEDAPTCPPGQNTSPEPCFIPDVPGLYRFELRATDVRPYCELGWLSDDCETDADCCSFQCGAGETCDGSTVDGICREGGGCSIDSVNTSVVEVRALGQGIIVYLEWDGTGDFDLHLVDDYGGRCSDGTIDPAQSCKEDTDCLPGYVCDTNYRREWGGAGDCFWGTAQPDWGEVRTNNGVSCFTSFDCVEYTLFPDCVNDGGGSYCTNTLDDPRLLRDETTAFGPEIIKLQDPFHDPGPPNVYHLGVLYFRDAVHYQQRAVTVYVYYEGREIFAVGQPGVRLSRAMQNSANGDDVMFWYVGWLVTTPADATLIANPAPLFNYAAAGNNYPPLQDPP